MEDGSPWDQVVARAIKDPAFKGRLMNDPVATLKDAGVAVPDGVKIKVFENTKDQMHLVLPTNPAEGAVTEAELERVAGGLSGARLCSEQMSGCLTQIHV